MNCVRFLALASFFVLVGCDPGQRYSVAFDAWAIGSPPTDRIVVDTSQMGDAVRKSEVAKSRGHGGGLSIQDVYLVDKPIKIIVVPLDEAEDAGELSFD